MQEYFDGEAVNYTEDVLEGTVGKKYLSIIERNIVEKMRREQAFATMRYLDIGVGNGRFILMLAPLFKQVLGLDLSPEMIRSTRERLPESLVPSVSFRQGNFETCDLSGDGRFDMVTSFRVFKYFSDIPAAIDKLSRITASGGFCVIQFPNSGSYQGLLYRARGLFFRNGKNRQYLDSLNLVGIEETRALFEKNGFRVEEVVGGTVLPYFVLARVNSGPILKTLVACDGFLKRVGLGGMCRDFTIVARKTDG